MPELQISRRVSALKPSVTVAFTNRAKQMRADGVDVLGFAAGEPDFDTPQAIKKAAEDALEAGQTKYCPTLGDMVTRETIARKLENENGIRGLSGNHIAICAGGKHALYSAMHCLLDPPQAGEEPWEVLLPVPAWVSYRPIAELAGGVVKELETRGEDDFKITPSNWRRRSRPAAACWCSTRPATPAARCTRPMSCGRLRRSSRTKRRAWPPIW